MDKDISAVFVGVLVSCFICIIVLNQRPQAKECIASMKDQYGNTHEIKGVIHD
jgi:hypothetical protein